MSVRLLLVLRLLGLGLGSTVCKASTSSASLWHRQRLGTCLGWTKGEGPVGGAVGRVRRNKKLKSRRRISTELQNPQ